jgi:hypothetical protein
MAMIPFFAVAGRRAADETRSIIIPDAGGCLPPDSYGFLEFYCDDPRCDCRRVIFQVWRQSTGNKIWATITYGWESPDYYAKWCHCGPGSLADEMAGAALEQISPQTELSADLLAIFREILLADDAYVARLKRHYQEARAAGREITRVRNPSGKVQRKMRELRRRRR